MGKAINAFIEKQPENDKNVIKLHVLDFNHKDGGYDKTVIKKRERNPTEKVILAVREVTYLYDKDKVTKGWEIVEEVTCPRDKAIIFSNGNPRVVGSVTRDLRTKTDQE
jgi:hypothetical protein